MSDFKNIVVFHLESVSNFIYKMNSQSFPTLNQMMENSEVFINYFSTATSTIMVTLDLFYGNTYLFEEHKSLENISKDMPQSMLSNIIKRKGYVCKNFFYSFEKNSTEALQELGEYFKTEDREDFLKNFDATVNQSQPFFAYISDSGGHISYQGKRLGNTNRNGRILFEERYRILDQTLKDILDVLEKRNKEEETMIIIYGDHGDDFWGHGFHSGYTHAIEPYSHIVNCPLLIFQKNMTKKICRNLVSTIDISKIILSKIEKTEFHYKRNYCFSRNLYAKQKINVHKFNKSYAVINEKYNLLITKKGLELHMAGLDPTNHMNLLDFFCLKKGQLYFRKIFLNVLSTHFISFMTKETIEEIEENFYLLFKDLQCELKQIYGNEKTGMKNRINYSSNFFWQQYSNFKICIYKSIRKIRGK